MRAVFAFVTCATLLAAVVSAQAERRIFILANNADGYGVDRCLANGEKCGAAVATAYCKSRQFSHAASYRKIDRNEITGLVPASDPAGCKGAACDDFVAIVCIR